MEKMKKISIFDRLQLYPSEIAALGIAWLVIILAFVPQALITPILAFTFGNSFFEPEFMSRASLMAFAIGGAFILHELGHKFAAQRFKARAAFQIDPRGLMITALSVALGFYLLMPGAVFWSSNLSKYDNIRGRVAAAGPVVNLLLASISLGLIAIGEGAETLSLGWIFFTFGQVSFFLNIYLGLFNMLPIWVLDGKKILTWNTTVYLTMMVMFVSLVMAGWFGFGIRFNFFIISFPPGGGIFGF
ncbi:MAG: hypothetical protein HeimC3_26770 [Candidatus Heimdallarchaeota archaeon LC_3]|nr:MAG: hypothetical protein HeimC3_26770 [Candidatus Heimdallarchaeota archaeon LC_3]